MYVCIYTYILYHVYKGQVSGSKTLHAWSHTSNFTATFFFVCWSVPRNTAPKHPCQAASFLRDSGGPCTMHVIVEAGYDVCETWKSCENTVARRCVQAALAKVQDPRGQMRMTSWIWAAYVSSDMPEKPGLRAKRSRPRPCWFQTDLIAVRRVFLTITCT